MSEQTYRQLALEDPHGQWELYCGTLRQKPPMTFEHNFITTRLFTGLIQQLDENVFQVRTNIGHVRRSSESFYIPDVYVVPMELVRPHRGRRDELEVYEVPLPLVIEIWSPSTGTYDVETKLREYQQRGDREIWLIHPYDHRLTAWRAQPDGTYAETVMTAGTIRPIELPGVEIDLQALFD